MLIWFQFMDPGFQIGSITYECSLWRWKQIPILDFLLLFFLIFLFFVGPPLFLFFLYPGLTPVCPFVWFLYLVSLISSFCTLLFKSLRLFKTLLFKAILCLSSPAFVTSTPTTPPPPSLHSLVTSSLWHSRPAKADLLEKCVILPEDSLTLT